MHLFTGVYTNTQARTDIFIVLYSTHYRTLSDIRYLLSTLLQNTNRYLHSTSVISPDHLSPSQLLTLHICNKLPPTIPHTCGNCVFPFIEVLWDGNTIQRDRCTSIDRDGPWCATSVGFAGVTDDWEYCTDPYCPGLPGNSPPMSVHPLNEVGSCCKSSVPGLRHILLIYFSPSDCGIPNRAETNTRIVGGSHTEVGEYPWQVRYFNFVSTFLHNPALGDTQ